MKIVLAGCTGFIGRELAQDLMRSGHDLILLSRSDRGSFQRHLDSTKLTRVTWDARTAGNWTAAIDGAHAIINLSGENIAAKRWTHKQKQAILDSRIYSAAALVNAVERAHTRPKVFLNASAVGFYGNVPAGDVTERTSAGSGFLANTCREWEAALHPLEGMGVRTVMLRIGIVLERGGGALAKMLLPFKLFLGGPLGSGRQWFPWIHRADVVDIVQFALLNERIRGPVNVTAPNPVTMNEFCQTLGNVLHRPSWAPVPAFALRIMLGEMSEMLLGGQRAIPEELIRHNYHFRYPVLKQALEAILTQTP